MAREHHSTPECDLGKEAKSGISLSRFGIAVATLSCDLDRQDKSIQLKKKKIQPLWRTSKWVCAEVSFALPQFGYILICSFSLSSAWAFYHWRWDLQGAIIHKPVVWWTAGIRYSHRCIGWQKWRGRCTFMIYVSLQLCEAIWKRTASSVTDPGFDPQLNSFLQWILNVPIHDVHVHFVLRHLIQCID